MSSGGPDIIDQAFFHCKPCDHCGSMCFHNKPVCPHCTREHSKEWLKSPLESTLAKLLISKNRFDTYPPEERKRLLKYQKIENIGVWTILATFTGAFLGFFIG